MNFIEVGNVTINLDRVESVDKRKNNEVHVVLASGQAYTFEGADAEGLRQYFTTPPPAPAPEPAPEHHPKPESFDFNPTGVRLEKTYPCGCHVTGGRDLPDYCPEHGHPQKLSDH